MQMAILLLTAILAFFWHNNPTLSSYSLQLIGFLVIIFIFHNWRFKKTNQNIINCIIINQIILLLILETGGTSSPLFFILDLQLFSFSLLLSPAISFGLGLILVLLFMLSSGLTNPQDLTNLISLLLMAPIAKIFGTQYLKLLEKNQQIKVLKYQSDRLKKQASVSEETTLLWLSLNFRNKMVQAIDLLSQIGANLSQFPYYQREKFNQVYSDLKELLKSGQELEKKIDEINDD